MSDQREREAAFEAFKADKRALAAVARQKWPGIGQTEAEVEDCLAPGPDRAFKSNATQGDWCRWWRAWQARAQQDISEVEREFLEAACLYFQNHKALEDAARRNDRSITDVLPRIGKAYVRARAAHDALLAAQQQGEEGGGDV